MSLVMGCSIIVPAALSSICAIVEMLSRVPWTLAARCVSPLLLLLVAAVAACSVLSSGAACIAVVAAVAGAAVVAGVVDAMGFACATLAARCVWSLAVAGGFCSAYGGVGLAAAGAVAVNAVPGGVGLAAVVRCFCCSCSLAFFEACQNRIVLSGLRGA